MTPTVKYCLVNHAYQIPRWMLCILFVYLWPLFFAFCLFSFPKNKTNNQAGSNKSMLTKYNILGATLYEISSIKNCVVS